MSGRNSLLIVAAHPDDEVLGCGATVRRMVSKGWQAHLVLFTGGVGGRHGADSAGSTAVQAEQENLRNQTRRAAEVIGLSKITMLDFPDNRMDTVGRNDLALALRPIVDDLKPSIVFTHHPGDYNWDHGRVFDAVMMAARPNPPEFMPEEVRTFEVLSSTERAWQEPSRVFLPNLYVDITATIDMKKLALRYYQSECRPYPHPRSIEAVEYLARKRGNEVGLKYAEAFHVVRKVEL
jgi:LmbE family N-acetylglucosaminyl deacetylase